MRKVRNRYERGKTRNIFSREKYNKILDLLKKDSAVSKKKSSTEYYYSTRFDVLSVTGIERFITKVPEGDQQGFKLYAYLEEPFGVFF